MGYWKAVDIWNQCLDRPTRIRLAGVETWFFLCDQIAQHTPLDPLKSHVIAVQTPGAVVSEEFA